MFSDIHRLFSVRIITVYFDNYNKPYDYFCSIDSLPEINERIMVNVNDNTQKEVTVKGICFVSWPIYGLKWYGIIPNNHQEIKKLSRSNDLQKFNRTIGNIRLINPKNFGKIAIIKHRVKQYFERITTNFLYSL